MYPMRNLISWNLLRWCGLHYSEGPDKGGPFEPYRQSERNVYRKFADALLESGNAYYAFDTPEDLNSLRKEHESQGKLFQYDASTRKGLNNSLSRSSAEVTALIESKVSLCDPV